MVISEQSQHGGVEIEKTRAVGFNFKFYISDWDKFKRKHALYFWPELLLEEVIKSATKKNKDRIRNFLTFRNDSLFAHGIKAIGQITYEMEAPQIIEMIQKLLDDIYKNEGKQMPKMSQFPNNLKSIKVEFN